MRTSAASHPSDHLHLISEFIPSQPELVQFKQRNLSLATHVHNLE